MSGFFSSVVVFFVPLFLSPPSRLLGGKDDSLFSIRSGGDFFS